MYKSRLTKDRDNALQAGDQALTAELNKKLEALEERAEELDRQRSSKISSIALINDKNRKRNIERAEQGIREEMARKLIEGEVHDPFTRRKTQPKIAQVKKETPVVVNPVAVEVSNEEATTEKEIKDEEEKKENKPLLDDLFSSHNFDVDIDLSVASPNNATNVNVKPVVRSGCCQFLFLSSTFVLDALKPQLPKMKSFTP